MHHCFLSDLHSILENTKPNTAEYDSAVTDLADTVFTSHDYEDVLVYMEHLFIHEGESKNNQVTFAGFYLLSVIYRRACDRQKLQSLITHGATRFEDNIDFKLVYLSCYEFCNPLGKSHAELLEDANTLCSRFPDRPSCLHVYAHIVASLMESGVEVDAAYLDEAIEFVDRAISLDSSYPKYRVTRARLYALKGDMNKAYIDFDKAVSLLHPTSPEYPKHLADIEAARLRADFLWSATLGFSPHFRIGHSFSTLVAPTSSKKVLNTALKLHLARVGSVQYACLTMTNVELRGGVRYGSAGCWQYRIC